MSFTAAEEFRFRQQDFVKATVSRLHFLNDDNHVVIFGCILQSLLGILTGLYEIEDAQCPIIYPTDAKDKLQFTASWTFLRTQVLEFAGVPVRDSNRAQFNYVLLLIYNELFESISARVVSDTIRHSPDCL